MKSPAPLLPVSADFEPVSGLAAFAQTTLDAVRLGRYQLALVSVELERGVHGTEEFTHVLRNFVLQHRRAQLRVLVHDPVSALRNSPRLVEFGRLLTSRVEFRAMPSERRRLREEFLVVDERALLYRSAPDQLEAKFYADAPMVARSHLREFDACWNEASVARELSGLGL